MLTGAGPETVAALTAGAHARGVAVRYAKGCGIASKSTSGIAESAPAPVCTNTETPLRSSSRTPSGVSATRCSAVLISLGTPTVSTGPAYGPGRSEPAKPVRR